MPSEDRFRRLVAREAARLIFTRQQTQYGRAKAAAARRWSAAAGRPDQMPDDRDIRRHLRAMDRAGAQRQGELTAEPPVDCGAAADRFRRYELLLAPLEHMAQSPEEHPEGDALYHSLQVFELARQALPYDEEFLLAALLHDVGKAIDRRDHVAAGLAALEGAISPRTAWLIEHHVDALEMAEGTLGARRRRRLEADESYDELMLLADCDRRGRTPGMSAPDVAEALAYLRRMDDETRDEV